MATFLPLVKDAGVTKQLPSGDTLLVRGIIDRVTAGTLTLGGVGCTANRVDIGKIGITTYVLGDFQVDGITTVVGNTVLDEDVTLGDASDDRIIMGGQFGTAGSPNFTFSPDAAHTMNVAAPAAPGAGISLTLAAGAANGANTGGSLTLNAGDGTDEGEVRVGVANTTKIIFGNAADASTTDFVGTGAITATGNPTWDFGTSQADFGGNLDANNGCDVTGANLTVGAAVNLTVGSNFTAYGASGNLFINGVIRGLTNDGTGVVIGHIGAGANEGSTLQLASFTDDTVRDYLNEAAGMVVWNADSTTVQYYNGAAWVTVAGSDISGTTNVGFQINLDNTGADEDANLNLVSGNGVNWFMGTWWLDATTDPPVLVYYTEKEGTKTDTIVSMGAPGEIENVDTTLRLSAGTGAANRVISLKLDGTAQTLTLSGTNVNSFDCSLNVNATAGLDVTGAAFSAAGGAIDLDPTAAFSLDMDAGFSAIVTIADAQANAFQVKEGANNYIDVNTTNAAEKLTFGNALNIAYEFVGTGLVDAANGTLDIPAGIKLLIGGSALTTASFTAANMTKLFDGSNCDALHVHAAGSSDISPIDTSGTTVGQVVYVSGASAVLAADANAIATGVPVGVTTVANAVGSLAARGKVTVNAEADVVAGDRVYLSTTAGRVCRSGGAGAPSAAGDVWVGVGVALTAAVANSCSVLWDVGEPTVI
jgi:hypothetical protein